MLRTEQEKVRITYVM